MIMVGQSKIYLSEMDREALERLFRECAGFREIVEDVARRDAESLIGGEYMYAFAGDYSIGDTRSDFVELSDDCGAVYRWYKRVQNTCEEFSYDECKVIEDYCAAGIDDDFYKLKSAAEDVILEHMRGIIRGNIEGADDFIEETVSDRIEDADNIYVEDGDFTAMKRYIPARIVTIR